MASPVSLLERIAKPRLIQQRTLNVDVEALRRSILRNLRNVLNTRLGSSMAQPDLGTPPPHEFMITWPESTGSLQRAIEQSIRRYEPRLTAIRVVPLPVDNLNLMLRFRVSARLKDYGGESVRFETNIEQSGAVACKSSR